VLSDLPPVLTPVLQWLTRPPRLQNCLQVIHDTPVAFRICLDREAILSDLREER